MVTPPGQVNCEASRGLQCIRSHGGHCKPHPTVTTVIIIPGGISEVNTTIPFPGGTNYGSLYALTLVTWYVATMSCDVWTKFLMSHHQRRNVGKVRSTQLLMLKSEKKNSLIKSGPHPPPWRERTVTSRDHGAGLSSEKAPMTEFKRPFSNCRTSSLNSSGLFWRFIEYFGFLL